MANHSSEVIVPKDIIIILRGDIISKYGMIIEVNRVCAAFVWLKRCNMLYAGLVLPQEKENQSRFITS